MKQIINNHMIRPVTIGKSEDKSNTVETKPSLLLQLVEDVEFFHDEQKVTYATINKQEHTETLRLDSDQFSSWLSQIYWDEYGEAIANPTKLAAISTMQGISLFDGVRHHVFTRVGVLNGDVYVDLANERYQVVKLSAHGWKIQNNSPVKFIRNKNMRPLPMPISDGDLNLIWKYTNIPEYAKNLVIGWLLECLRLDTDYPILVLHGTKGSAKSTSQEFLCNLIDPSAAVLRSAPRNIDDVLVAAANSHVISFNNLSKLTQANQDDLCSVSTGGSIGTYNYQPVAPGSSVSLDDELVFWFTKKLK